MIPSKYQHLADDATRAGFDVSFWTGTDGCSLLNMEINDRTVFYLQIVPGKRTIARVYDRMTGEDNVTSIAAISAEFSKVAA